MTGAELLAAGYPHLRILGANTLTEADAIAAAERALDDIDPIAMHVTWPRDVAQRYLRGLAEVGAHGIGIFSLHEEVPLPETRAARAAIAKGGDIDAKTARAIVGKLLAPEVGGYEFHAHHAVFLLEQFVGGAAVVDAVLATWEAAKPQTWDDSALANQIAYALGFVLARLPAKAAAPLASRARKLAAAGRAAESYTGEFLDFAVDGAAAVARSTDRKAGLYFLHFVDDPAQLCALATKMPDQIDAHHLHRVGNDLLEILEAKLARVPKWRKKWLADELGVLGTRPATALAAKLAPAAKKPKPAAKKKSR